MQKRQLGPYQVSAISLGCMNLSHAYGTPPDEDTAAKVLHHALDLGINHLDSAALYGFGKNEELLGRVLKDRRDEFVLASKCGLFRNAEGKREVDGRPETIRRVTEESLQRLRTDVIDLHYLHRWDKRFPIEESVGVMADMVKEGKIKHIGLCEVSAETLRKAHAVHPIAALQTEYSLWTREPEIAVIDACHELGTAFVAFSPLARGVLTGKLRDIASLPEKDIRHNMPRFQGENWEHNLQLADRFAAIAEEAGCTPAQLALAWMLHQGDHIIPIPGTTKIDHLEEDLGTLDVHPSPEILARVDKLINQDTVAGPRYGAKTQEEIDTEMF